MDSSDCENKKEQDKVTLFSKCDVYEGSHTGVNSFDSLACQVNLWRDAKVPKEGNKHISIRPSSFYITADSDHLVHWKTDERRGHKEHPENTKRTQKKNSTVSSHPMIYESCWQCCVSSHASLPGNSMRQICSDSMPGETCWPSMSQISTNTRLFVWRLVYWEVNGVKTLLCVCKVAKFARGRQPTKKGDRCAPGSRAVFASIFSCNAGIFFLWAFHNWSVGPFLWSRHKHISCLTYCH